MDQVMNSPENSKIYACVVKSPMRTLYKHISLKFIVKFIDMR